jgi:hypothetical protein
MSRQGVIGKPRGIPQLRTAALSRPGYQRCRTGGLRSQRSGMHRIVNTGFLGQKISLMQGTAAGTSVWRFSLLRTAQEKSADFASVIRACVS